MPKTKTLRQIVGENTKAIRTERKMTQQEVVDAAKKKGGRIDQTTIGRIERSVHPTSVDSLDALSKGLGVHAWELLIPDKSDEKFIAILKAWAQGSDGGRKLLGIAAEGALREYEHEHGEQQRQAGAPIERSRAGGR